jgi:hypothetical protein
MNYKKLNVNPFDEYKPDLEMFLNDGIFDPENTSGDDYNILHSCSYYG